MKALLVPELQNEQRCGVEGDDPRLMLARRLRALREDHWPGMRITQPQLARALGGGRPLSVPLISSWESQANPKIPPPRRLEAYAALFACPRSFTSAEPGLISPKDMSEEERQSMAKLRRELMDLRSRAMGALGAGRDMAPGDPWHFEDGGTITVVCAQWPPDMLERIPYTDMNDPDYIELLTYSDLDSLVMSYGHLRAANPTSQVDYFRSGLLPTESYKTHLVSLGGTDWNILTADLMVRLNLPVKQVADWGTDGGVFFEVEGESGKAQHRAILQDVGGREVLREDVALFARAVNPFNQRRIVTICSGMYGRGAYGVVRALTDPEFRVRNHRYLESRFKGSLPYCLLTRVQVVNNQTLVPDWTDDDTRLFEWSGSADAG
jgi:transcriptional regulator with XRE-family HTH domain